MKIEINCTLEKDGFIGHFYPGTKETSKAIISVGGSIGIRLMDRGNISIQKGREYGRY